MSQSKTINASLLFCSMALGSMAPAYAGGFGSIQAREMHQASGQEGVGFGALVLPSTSELGQLSATLYDDADQSVAYLSGTLSLYMPIAGQREQFGGFSGTVRQLQPSPLGSPSISGWAEGTWAMNGNGQGTLQVVVTNLDAKGNSQIVAAIDGQFDAVSVSLSSIQTAGPQPIGPTTTLPVAQMSPQAKGQPTLTRAYSVLRRVQEHIQGQQARSPRDFSRRLQKARGLFRQASFGARTPALTERIAQALRQAQAQAEDDEVITSLPAVPTENHIEAHLGLRYKILNG